MLFLLSKFIKLKNFFNFIDLTNFQQKTKMAQIAGSWKLTNSENFDELMKELGVGLLTRKIGNTTKPTVTVTVDGDSWDMVTESALKTHKLHFKLNEETETETMDGRKVKVSVIIDHLKDQKL